jgi:pimeloyl-ACP methyl ester carboxylesterase
MNPRPIGVITLAAAGLFVGCSGPAQSTSLASIDDAGASTSPAPTTSPDSSPPPFGHFVVDGERELFITCAGSGSPVILMEAGGGDESTAWSPIMMNLAEHTMVCAYDRAGTGRSDPAPNEPRAASDVQDDLDALMEAAGIEPPYLLVGQSFGGATTLFHAMQHPERVAGMVIVDSDWPTTDPERDPMRVAMTDAQWAEFMGDGEQWDDEHNTEHIDFETFAGEVEGSVHALPGVPIRILSATQPGDCPPELDCELMIAKSIEFQKQWLELSPDAVQILVEGGHNLHEDNPEVVIAEILTALDDSRLSQ